MGGVIDEKKWKNFLHPSLTILRWTCHVTWWFFFSLACPLYFLLFLCSLPLSLFLSLCQCGNQKQSHRTFIGEKYFSNHLQFRSNNTANSITLWRKRGHQPNPGTWSCQSRYLLLLKSEVSFCSNSDHICLTCIHKNINRSSYVLE